MAKIQDVAKLAGTSIATVSRVVNNSPHKVKSETRQRVLEAIEQLNYQPNTLARSLIKGRTQTVGVIIPDISNPYYAEIVRGIQDMADKWGYSITLQNTDRRHDRIVSDILMLRSKVVDGIIFSGGIIHGDEPLAALKELRTRVVVIGRHEVNFPAVLVDNIEGASQATQHLIDLGHQVIGCIAGPEGSTTTVDRMQGYKSTLAQNAIAFDEKLVMRGNLTAQSGYDAALALLSLERRPSAIFAANDLMAIGAMRAILDQGFEIPKDISVVGFDNVPLAPYLCTPLTSVAIPMHGLGEAAMEALVGLMTGREFKRRNWLNTELVIRKSTAAARS